MNLLLAHLVVLPIVLPLLSAALLLFLGDKRRLLKSVVNVASTFAGLVLAVTLLLRVDQGDGAGQIGVYLASNWKAPFGIVLVADRLSALMLVLVGVVGLAAAVYAEAGWSRASVYFHPLFQIQLMGLCGAFLTGDLFNLFVFFEVMLAASYGLQLHGSGAPRVRSGLHYIAVNLLASSLFLVGLSVLYGVVGTLNMADVAQKIALVPERDRGLLHAGTAILAVAFLIKAATWPLNAWLVPAYSATSAPVAALFALMTKVGIYVLLRAWTLFFSALAGDSAHFGQEALLLGGLSTIAFGAMGLMASYRAGRIASYSIIVSSGTLLASVGMGDTAVTSAALFYMLSATLAASALFLLVELVERIGAGRRAELPDVDGLPGDDTNLDDAEMPLVGRPFPISLAALGLVFMACAMLVAGLPPLSGFLAKFAIIAAVLDTDGAAPGSGPSLAGWGLVGLMLLSGLASMLALVRAGIRHFWSTGPRTPPRLKAAEGVGVVALIALGIALTISAEPVIRYTNAAASGLHSPQAYIDAVLSAEPRPGPTQSEPSP